MTEILYIKELTDRLKRLEHAMTRQHGEKCLMEPDEREADDLLDEIVESVYANSKDLFAPVKDKSRDIRILLLLRAKERYGNLPNFLAYFLERAHQEKKSAQSAEKVEAGEEPAPPDASISALLADMQADLHGVLFRLSGLSEIERQHFLYGVEKHNPALCDFLRACIAESHCERCDGQPVKKSDAEARSKMSEGSPVDRLFASMYDDFGVTLDQLEKLSVPEQTEFLNRVDEHNLRLGAFLRAMLGERLKNRCDCQSCEQAEEQPALPAGSLFDELLKAVHAGSQDVLSKIAALPVIEQRQFLHGLDKSYPGFGNIIRQFLGELSHDCRNGHSCEQKE